MMRLERGGIDTSMTALAKAGKLHPVIGRNDEIHRCIQILSVDWCVGKTAIAQGLAQ